ncbi:phosphomethylpyrimidine kinase [Candidatus Magnetoovum chiemensis]|nr:phosphomethylpyrimidine kinase [Candidatus Magnetoovum chiemensis]
MNRCALTAAGFDPSGGAGIAADLKVFHSHGIHSAAVITAITAQNTQAVEYVEGVSAETFKKQLECLLKDITPDAIKTGLLYSKEIICILRDLIIRYNLSNLIIDPVIISSSGKRLVEDGVEDAMINELFPLATLITPNIAEAQLLCGVKITNEDDIKESLKRLKQFEPKGVIITGGDLLSSKAIDICYYKDEFIELESDKIAGSFHGTGCSFSAALAANLAHGYTVIDAVRLSKKFIDRAVKEAFWIGLGMGILND